MLTLHHVTKTYGKGHLQVDALRDVELQVDTGEFVAVIGPSGSGKTTLMNILGCLDDPTQGEYLLDGVPVGRLSGREKAVLRNREIGFVFQSFNLVSSLTAQENVELPLVFRGMEGEKRRELSRLALEQVGLSRAAELLGLDVSGMDHHRALDDSLVTLQVLRRVYDRQAIASYIDLCDREFYRRITFKTTYVCDLHSPLVEKSHLRFPCPRCGEESRRLTKWSLKNKSFRADFRCTRCGHLFAGRLTIKQKYEGLAVNKKTFPLPDLESPRQAVAGPVGDMELTLPQGVGVLRFAGWKDLDFVNHAFTTRIGGVSEGQFASMNLGFNRGDEENRVAENYRRFCAAAGFDPDSLVCGAQDHHINIRRVGTEQRGIGIWREKDMDSIDGLCTDDSSVTLVIYCADCVPLYFVDPEHHAIGLAHAGWRGTAAGMAKAMTERMALEFSTRPEALRVAIGPSIGKECFEVDEPVALEFLKLPQAEKFVTGPQRDKYHVDLWECNRQFLLSAGVKEEHITVGQVCTMCESDLIFSHRKTRGQRGSNCAMLALGDKKA